MRDVRLKALSLVLVEFPGLFWKVYFGLTDHFFNFFVSNLRIPVTPLYLQKINWIGSRTVLILYVMNTLTKAFFRVFCNRWKRPLDWASKAAWNDVTSAAFISYMKTHSEGRRKMQFSRKLAILLKGGDAEEVAF